MSELSRQQRIDLFQSLFRGREDVFAMHWQKFGTDIAGYTPVFTDRNKTTYKSLTQGDIEQHLLGNVTLGVYPLLKDATTYFIVADFDEKEWQSDAQAFIKVCVQYGIPVALEVSRSGNGAHVWCFFEQPFKAFQSRKLFLALLREAKCIDDYTRDESFDRLFPNQDVHSGKGLGNLIALPLQGKSRKENKTVFIDPTTLTSFPDQWDFLSGIERLTERVFETLYEKLCSSSTKQYSLSESLPNAPLRIEISNRLQISKQQVPPAVVAFLREELNFFNTEYLVKNRTGFSTHGIEKFFKTVFTDDDFVYIPRGYIHKLTTFLSAHSILFEIVDHGVSFDPIEPLPIPKLYGYQQRAVEDFADATEGILVAPPGSGKTIMGLVIALATGQSTLILTHRQNILDQWTESIQNFLGIPKKDIGKYVGATKKAKQPFTVAMMQTLARAKDKETIMNQFGCVIVDECHHVPAKLFREVVAGSASKYLFGLTATPKRKYNDQKLITAYMGEILHTVPGTYAKNTEEAKSAINSRLSVTVLKSDFSIPYDIASKDFAHLHKLLSFDTNRNALIAEAIKSEVSQKRRVLVIAERKEHLESLKYFLRKNVDALVMTGTLSAIQKRYRMTRIKNGTFQVILATGQFFGEGVDASCFDSLFLVSPISFEGKLVQYMGRLRKGENEQRVFDIRDPKVELLEKCFKKRMTVYTGMVKTGELACVREAGSFL
jgi:superfamily II DNA or RNA helicase